MTTVVRPVGSAMIATRCRPAACSIQRSSTAHSSRVSASCTLQARNPVMFVVLVGSVLTTILFFRDLVDSTAQENVFSGLVAVFLWFTVLFATLPRRWPKGGARPKRRRCARPAETTAHRRRSDGTLEEAPSSASTLATSASSRPAR